ncbi:MAG: hypothetical protein P1Q69_17400 [Candidatus Thorarchaeota archaeon]|nr:hypothetical protein [Candidatus Thorarchaeota archaeon]
METSPIEFRDEIPDVLGLHIVGVETREEDTVEVAIEYYSNLEAHPKPLAAFLNKLLEYNSPHPKDWDLLLKKVTPDDFEGIGLRVIPSIIRFDVDEIEYIGFENESETESKTKENQKDNTVQEPTVRFDDGSTETSEGGSQEESIQTVTEQDSRAMENDRRDPDVIAILCIIGLIIPVFIMMTFYTVIEVSLGNYGAAITLGSALLAIVCFSVREIFRRKSSIESRKRHQEIIDREDRQVSLQEGILDTAKESKDDQKKIIHIVEKERETERRGVLEEIDKELEILSNDLVEKQIPHVRIESGLLQIRNMSGYARLDSTLRGKIVELNKAIEDYRIESKKMQQLVGFRPIGTGLPIGESTNDIFVEAVSRLNKLKSELISQISDVQVLVRSNLEMGE